jgi:hydroxyacylglutathione hydrolase
MQERTFGPLRFIPGSKQGKYPYCHSIYVPDAGVLIDPSSDRDALKRLREGPGVRAVWLTHWHEDHWMHLDLFDDVPLWMSLADAPPMSDLETQLDWYGITGDFQGGREYWRKTLLDRFSFRPRRPARHLEPGEVLHLGDISVEVLHTPGHTPGHLSFFFREPAVLFLGDYDLSPFGPWYGDVRSSIEQTVESVERLRRVPARTWITSHEEDCIFQQDPGDRWDLYLGVIGSREDKLLELLDRRPMDMREIVEARIVYGRPREPRMFFDFNEQLIMAKHLEALQEQGRLTKENGRYRRL